jgi:hypothetical protein
VNPTEADPLELRPAELDRWASIRVATLLRLPDGNVRAFMVAASIGSILDENGTTNQLRNAAKSPGVLVTKKRAIRIRQMLGISPQRWRAYVADWTDRYVAHRCSPGVVVLFTRPFLDECPACRKYTEGPGKRKATIIAKPRGRPFQESAADASAETPQRQALRAANRFAGAPQRQAVLSTSKDTPKDRVAMRGERRSGEEVAVQRPSAGSREGSRESRRERESEAWPVPEGGTSRRGVSVRGRVGDRAGRLRAMRAQAVLRSRSGEIRRELQVLNPVTEPNYERLFFQVLIEVDRDIGTLKGRFRKQRNAT